MMTLKNLRTIVLACGLLTLAYFAQSSAVVYSIGTVALNPKSPVPFGSGSTLSVFFWTSGEPTFLYQPTEVGRTGNMFRIKIYPGHPEVVKAVEGGFTERVTLGPLAMGNYQYKVELHPRPDDTPGGIMEAEGNFAVAPQLRLNRSGTTVTLRWPSAASNYVLQVATQLSPEAVTRWTNVQATPSVIDTELVVTQPIMTRASYFRLKTKD